jgi:hypothetical protein
MKDCRLKCFVPGGRLVHLCCRDAPAGNFIPYQRFEVLAAIDYKEYLLGYDAL